MEEKDRIFIIENLNSLIQRTSDEAFRNLLKIFEEKNMLNSYMLKKIRNHENIDERKRAFYEMIPKRGPKAFKLLKDSLRDEGLANLVRRTYISSGSEHSVNGQDPFYEDGSCIGKFNNENIQNRYSENNNSEAYRLESVPKGFVLIVNNETFQDSCLDQPRHGSVNDVKRLRNVFKNRGYKVIEKHNLNSMEFQRCIETFTQMEELKDVDSAILFVMTHGKGDPNHSRKLLLSMHDNIPIESEWIIQQFSSIKCKYLADKPKIIVFQACRGKRADGDVGVAMTEENSEYSVVDGNFPEHLNQPLSVTDGFTSFDTTLLKIKRVPSLGDVLVVYSTLPGRLAERDSNGSFFVQDFCDYLEDEAKIDIIELIKKVGRRLRERFHEDPPTIRYMQVPHYESLGFNKTYYLTKS